MGPMFYVDGVRVSIIEALLEYIMLAACDEGQLGMLARTRLAVLGIDVFFHEPEEDG